MLIRELFGSIYAALNKINYFNKYGTSCIKSKYLSKKNTIGSFNYHGCGHISSIYRQKDTTRFVFGLKFDTSGAIEVLCDLSITVGDNFNYEGCSFCVYSTASITGRDDCASAKGKTLTMLNCAGRCTPTRNCSHGYQPNSPGYPAGYYCDGAYSKPCSSSILT